MTHAHETHAEPAAPAPEGKGKKTKAVKEAVPVAPKIEQNGVARPAAGTVTGRVWEVADEISRELGAPADRKSVIEALVKEGVNASTGATQYGKWRKFHGLVGADAPGNRAPSVPPAAPAAPAEVVTE